MEKYWPLRRVGQDDKVWVAKDVETEEEVIMKRSEVSYGENQDRNDAVQAEAILLRDLSKNIPNRVIGFRAFYKSDENHFCLIMDKADCCVADILAERKYLTEDEVKIVIHAVLEGLAYLHKKYFVHRDLKPQNLLLMNSNDLNSLKLGDFGTAVEENGYSNIGGVTGTRGYMAPEVLKKTFYGRPVDIWSLGVVAYQLLFGDLPFNVPAKALNPYTQLIKAIPPSYKSQHAYTISSNAKSFIESCLQADPSKRPTAAKALEHPWFKAVQQQPSSAGVPAAGVAAPVAKTLQVVPEKVPYFEGWLKLHQPHGPAYYFHEPTGVTQWHHPSEQAGAPPQWVNPYEGAQSASSASIPANIPYDATSPVAQSASAALPPLHYDGAPAAAVKRSQTVGAAHAGFNPPPRGVSNKVEPKRFDSDPTASPPHSHRPLPQTPVQQPPAEPPVGAPKDSTPPHAAKGKVRFVELEDDDDEQDGNNASIDASFVTANGDAPTTTAAATDKPTPTTPTSAASPGSAEMEIIDLMAAPTLPRGKVPERIGSDSEANVLQDLISAVKDGSVDSKSSGTPTTATPCSTAPVVPGDKAVESPAVTSPVSASVGSPRANSSLPSIAYATPPLPPTTMATPAAVKEATPPATPPMPSAATPPTAAPPTTPPSSSAVVTSGSSESLATPPTSGQTVRRPSKGVFGFVSSFFGGGSNETLEATKPQPASSPAATPVVPAPTQQEASPEGKAVESAPASASSPSHTAKTSTEPAAAGTPSVSVTPFVNDEVKDVQGSPAPKTSPMPSPSPTPSPEPHTITSPRPFESDVEGVKGWKMVTLPAGAVYYYDTVTQTARWHLPNTPATSPWDELPAPPPPPKSISRRTSAPSTKTTDSPTSAASSSSPGRSLRPASSGNRTPSKSPPGTPRRTATTAAPSTSSGSKVASTATTTTTRAAGSSAKTTRSASANTAGGEASSSTTTVRTKATVASRSAPTSQTTSPEKDASLSRKTKPAASSTK